MVVFVFVCIWLWVDNLFVFDCAMVVRWLWVDWRPLPSFTESLPSLQFTPRLTHTPGGGRFGRFISFRIWQMNFWMEFVLRIAFGWFICLTAAIFEIRLNGQFSDGILTQTFHLFNSFFSLILTLKLIRHFKDWFPPLALRFHSQKRKGVHRKVLLSSVWSLVKKYCGKTDKVEKVEIFHIPCDMR